MTGLRKARVPRLGKGICQRLHHWQCRGVEMTMGSLAMENVSSWVAEARCHLAGMGWSEVGPGAMLRLRFL